MKPGLSWLLAGSALAALSILMMLFLGDRGPTAVAGTAVFLAGIGCSVIGVIVFYRASRTARPGAKEPGA